jgi:hypothetical protein
MTKYIPDLPLPAGITTTRELGDRLGWGTGDGAARRRAATISFDEIKAIGITLTIAEAWLAFYEGVLEANPTNPSVRGRIELMARIMELLG